MSREIKFRLWTGSKMVKQERRLSGSNGFVECMNFWTGYEDTEEWVGYKFLQYTGLKDRNGVEIYEGDILCVDRILNSKFKGVVNFQCGIFQIKPIEGLIPTSPICHWAQDGVEVIGNIYENPDLLQETE